MRIISAPFSAIIMIGAWMLPVVISGNPIQAVDANAARFRTLQVVPRANRDYALDIRLMRGPSQSLREFAVRARGEFAQRETARG